MRRKGTGRKGTGRMGVERKGAESVVCACVGGAMKGGEYAELEGSYTVEAAFVMSITLLFIAALLTGIFQVHSRVAGRFVLQEALERRIFLEDSEAAEQGRTEAVLLREEAERLRGFFRCGDGELTMKKTGERLYGRVDTGIETEIKVKDYDPEEKLRFFAVLEVQSRGEESGDTLQKRDEP